MRAFAMQGVDLLFSPLEPRASPVADHVHRLPHADGEGDEHRADRHGKDDERHGAQFKLS